MDMEVERVEKARRTPHEQLHVRSNSCRGFCFNKLLPTCFRLDHRQSSVF
jgi:hypothetical protein